MVQNSISSYTKEVTPGSSVMDIYSTKRSEVSQAITEYLNSKLQSEYGINVASALIIDVQLDDALKGNTSKEQAKQMPRKRNWTSKQRNTGRDRQSKGGICGSCEIEKAKGQAGDERDWYQRLRN